MRKLLNLALAVVLAFGVTGCKTPTKENEPKSNTEAEAISKEYFEVKDGEGTLVKIPTTINRIVSTAPSNTDILVGLGLADKLVAIDTYAVDIEGIDKDIVTMDFLTPDIELILTLQPDIVIASSMSKESGSDPFAVFRDGHIPVVYIPTGETVDGIYEDINLLATITNTKEKGDILIKEMQEQMNKIKQISNTIQTKKTVYFEISPAPDLYSFGNRTFMNELLQIAGGINIFESETSWISPDEESVIGQNPDVILSTVDYVENPIEEIKSRHGWEGITAVQNDDIYMINPNYVSRPSHNAVLGLLEISKALYPEHFKNE